jgi:hypothetical protein
MNRRRIDHSEDLTPDSRLMPDLPHTSGADDN